MHNKLLTAQDGRFSMFRRIVPIACTQNVQPHRYSTVLVGVMTTCIRNVFRMFTTMHQLNAI